METRGVQTSQGPVVFWERPDDSRPTVLVIRGAFPERDDYRNLPLELPECRVLLTHLPGMHTPFLPESSVETFARAFDEALPGAHVLGVSTGGLVAMAMKTAKSVVAIDPPLQTEPLWPLRAFLQNIADNAQPQMRAWVRNVLGVPGPNIDYRPLVKPEHTVIIAGEPLEPERAPQPMPGLINREDREWLRSHCKTVTVPCGHNILAFSGPRAAVVQAVRDAIRLSATV